jgi:hypothetical protein
MIMAVTHKTLTSERIGKRSWGNTLASVVALMGSLITLLTYILAALAVSVLVNHTLNWGTRTLDDIRYGFPRNNQVSGVVGHGDSEDTPTHLIALNLDGQVSLLEIPGGDPEQVRVLAGPYLFGNDGAYEVPRLTLRDMDGDGLADVILTVRGEMIVYVNKDGTFRLPTAAERATLEKTRHEGK